MMNGRMKIEMRLRRREYGIRMNNYKEIKEIMGNDKRDIKQANKSENTE